MNKGIVVLLLGLAVVGGVILVTKTLAASKTKVLVTAAFASIGSKLIRAWVLRDEKWLMYDPLDLIGSDLTYVVAGETITVGVTEACTLTYGGNTYNLIPQWNTFEWKEAVTP